MRYLLLILISVLLVACNQAPEYDMLIINGEIIDGSGKKGFQADIGILADNIAAIGDLNGHSATEIIDASGKVVTPGFINMLSWATRSLIEDGRSMGDIKQGVTLEVFGEGWSMGPLNDSMKIEMKRKQGDIKFEIEWTTLGEYLQFLEEKGISTNVASFVGATTVRIHELGYENRAPNPEEMERMKSLVREAMEEGALGVGSSLIYAPAFYSSTEELIELCKVAAKYNGRYISHMRSEGDRIEKSIDELIRIAAEAGIPAEIYHLKLSGRENWNKFDAVISKIDSANNAGLSISTNMYNYIAGGTGLDAAMPPWVQEGGYDQWSARLQQPEIRSKVISEMQSEPKDWENLMRAAGSADKLLLVGFKNDSLRHLIGKTLAEVAEMMGKSPEETAIDLVIADGSRVEVIYFLMSEENVKKQIKLPYMAFGSDGGSMAPEGVFLNSGTHPRAYGNFARLLAKYVREEQVVPIENAIYKLSYLPASRLGIEKRGLLKEGYFADIAIFDPEQIQDHATFEQPHQLATGMDHVIVNGELVLKNGNHTGKFPGRFIKGQGAKN